MTIYKSIKTHTIASLLIMTGIATAQAETTLPVLRLTIDATPTAGMDYTQGTMRLTDERGKEIILPVKVKTRGATAQQYMMKPALNMKLRNEDYTEEVDSALLGMRDCSSYILDAMAIDRICMRNRVAFDVWNSFSRLPYNTEFDSRNGTDGRFIELFINDTYYGIYCLTDRINRKLLNLKKVKEQADGTYLIRGLLYKHGTQDIANQNEPCYSSDYRACVVQWHNAWELTYPDDYASEQVWQPLRDALLTGFSTPYVKKYFYLDNLADYQLLVMALSISDNWGNKNKFFSIRNSNKDIDAPLADDADRRRFVLTPWDLDTSLGGAYDGTLYAGNYSNWPVADIMKNAPYPITVLAADAEYRTLLTRRWYSLRRTALSVATIAERMRTYVRLFLESGAWQRMVEHFDNQAARPCYVDDIADEVEQVILWYEARHQEMDRYFGTKDIPQDTNLDMEVDTQDVLAVYNHILTPDADPTLYDVNADGVVDTQDVLYIYDYIQSQ